MNKKDMVSQNEEAEMNSFKEGEVDEKITVNEREQLGAELQDANNKYLRLYAEFENYKKRVNKDKEELIRYSNESLLYDLLPSIDHLEMALKHAPEASSGLVQGVEMTLKELRKTLEKFGLTEIEAYGKPFDPALHHAMSQVERDDIEDGTVVEEFRKGYMLKDKVLRPSLVAVSKNPLRSGENEQKEEGENNNMIDIEEES